MKTLLLCSLLLYVFTHTLPAEGQLTEADFNKIRLMFHEQTEPMKKDIAWIRGRIEGIEKQVSHSTNVTYGLIALIVAAIAIPQIILAWRRGKDRSLERRVEALAQEIETLKQQRIVSP